MGFSCLEHKGLTLLMRAGVLRNEVSKWGSFYCIFVNRAAERFVNKLLFPNRLPHGAMMTSDVFSLMKQVIATMSAGELTASAKRNSATAAASSTSTSGVASSTEFPITATFQHAIFSGLQQCTCSNVDIFPELSEYVHDASISGTTVAEDKTAGRFDFYLHSNSNLQWGIEVRVQGGAVGDYEFRLSKEGTYAALVFAQSVEVDIRKGSCSEDVTVSDLRMTVYFPTDDFKCCTVVCGHKSPVTIHLQD